MADPGRDYLLSVYNQAHPNAPMDASGLTGVNADAAAYPAFAPFMQIPEIADLLHQASAGGWTTDQLALHIYETNWWKQNSDTQRSWASMKMIDPAKAAQQKQQMYQQVSTEAQLLGVPVSAQQIDFISEGAISEGWSADVLKNAIAGNAQFNKDQAGTITATQTSLQGIAASQGLAMSPQTTFDWARKIAQGTTDQNGFAEYAKGQAAIHHPYWQKQINEGITVRQLADPYVQQASKLLEISPDKVDLSDPKWSFVTHNKDGSYVPMSQTDWNRKLMSDPAYGYDRTSNAHEAAFQMIDQLKQSFGAA